MTDLQTIYNDVDELKMRVTALETQCGQLATLIDNNTLAINNLTNSLQEVMDILDNDTGWNTLALAEGITPHSGQQITQYRRVGKQVFLRGIFLGEGITINNPIAVLPEGFRPSQRIMKLLPNNSGYDRLEIETDGTIKIAWSTMPEQLYRFHSFSDISFFIN